MPCSNYRMEALESRRHLSGGSQEAGGVASSAASLPAVYSVSPASLSAARQALNQGNAALQPALGALLKKANNDLNQPPLAVTQKPNPPGISSHDYVSYATYYWPNPNTASGLPYVFEDGKFDYAMINKGDSQNLQIVFDDTHNLALAYYFTGNTAYATKAAQMLEVWFVNRSTRMNANLNHTQIELGVTSGTATGIIDSRGLYELVDTLGLLGSSPAWTRRDRAAMKSWMSDYCTWLRTSRLGKAEANEPNNQGTWYDVQTMSALLYLGQTRAAASWANALRGRIGSQIRSDGSQPYELSRADGWTYSNFNLQALDLTANLAERVGVNLWTYTAASGGSIHQATDYLAPYANPQLPWPGTHDGAPLTQGNRDELAGELIEAHSVYGGFNPSINLLSATAVASNEMNLSVDAQG
jgi:hypothetical protein